jgi:magnesium chelatase family protein
LKNITLEQAPGERTPGDKYFNNIRGQHAAKRALEICAAGFHSCLFVGPPGTGKSMLAKSLPELLPPMSYEQAIETAKIHSVSYKGFDLKDWQHRPFRSPHHTASTVAIVGGGAVPKPGEISLAHHGVLFLDELPEFNRNVLEALREPLETGKVTLSRAGRHAEYASRFQLIATMNPCPCGYAGDPKSNCRCTREQVTRYVNRLSGPVRDRIDILIQVPRLSAKEIIGTPGTTGAATDSGNQVRQRITNAFARQIERQGKANSMLGSAEIESICVLKQQQRKFLCQTIDQLRLSTRSYHKILCLARTIADLATSPEITQDHLTEAVGYRKLPDF